MNAQDLMTTPALGRLVVLLDPGMSDGDSRVALARRLIGPDGHLHLVAAMTGPEAWALRAYADSEELSVKDAAAIYVHQVVERLGHDNVSTALVEVVDTKDDVADLVRQAEADGAVMPASLAARVMTGRRDWTALPFPVLILPSDQTGSAHQRHSRRSMLGSTSPRIATGAS